MSVLGIGGISSFTGESGLYQRATRETGNVITQICLLNVRERRGVSTGTDGFGI